jgi:hypothetical protein
MQTLTVFIQQANTTTLTSFFPVTFDIFIAESNTARSKITIKSAYVEVYGISSVTSGDITIGVDFVSGLLPAGNTNYTNSTPGTSPRFWNVIKQVTGLNWDCPSCTDVSNNLNVTVTGTGITSSLVDARIYITYYYEP